MEGRLYASVLSEVSFFDAHNYAKKLQNKGMLKYGPFITGDKPLKIYIIPSTKSIVHIFKKIRLRLFRYHSYLKRNVKEDVK